MSPISTGERGPPVGILPGWKRAKPYVYSDAEIDALLAAALALPPEDGLRRWTYHTLFGHCHLNRHWPYSWKQTRLTA